MSKNAVKDFMVWGFVIKAHMQLTRHIAQLAFLPGFYDVDPAC